MTTHSKATLFLSYSEDFIMNNISYHTRTGLVHRLQSMVLMLAISLSVLSIFSSELLSKQRTESKAVLESGANAATQTQTVRGHISDAESNAPIPGIRVSITIDSTHKLGAVSDKQGNFRVKNVPLGRWTLRATGIGYQEHTIQEMMVAAGKESLVDISMIERVHKMEEVVVSVDRSVEKTTTVNEYSSVSARAFNIEDTKKYAGSLGDPSRMAQNFAGVTGANDSRNDIVVRGNSPSGMLWQLEGMNIPNPNHFGAMNSTGGPVSILNNNTLDKSDFFSGAFPAQYGNATAGVFDLHMRNGNAEQHEFVAQIGFNGFELGAEGPLGSSTAAANNSNNSSFLINYRYSTLGFFKTIGVSFGTGGAIPNYQDLTMKFNIQLSDRSRLSVFAIGGMSDIDLLGNEQDTNDVNLYGDENQNTRVKYSTGIAGVSYESNISDQTFAKFTLGLSGAHEQFNGDSIDVRTRIAYPSGEALFNTLKYSAVANLRHKFDVRNSLSAGFTVDRTQFNLQNKTMKGDTERILVHTEDGAALIQAFTQWKYRFSDALSSIVGVHVQHYELGNQTVVEPRASLQYTSEDGHSISIGYGLHSQTQGIYDYFVQDKIVVGTSEQIVYANKNMGFTRSHHLVLSYDWNFAANWRVKTEVYHQWLFSVPISKSAPSFSIVNTGNSFAPLNETYLVNEGTARNYGVEFSVERFFKDGFYLLGTASLFDSKYKGSDGIERNTAFNMGYVANLLGGKEFALGGGIFSIGLRVSATGGRYLTPLDEAASKQMGYAVYDESRAYSDKQSAYFRTDLKIGYRLELGSSTMEFSIDFQNLTNHKNIFQQSYDRRTNSIGTVYQQGFFPVPLFRYTF